MNRVARSRADPLLWIAALGLAGAAVGLSLLAPCMNPRVFAVDWAYPAIRPVRLAGRYGRAALRGRSSRMG